MLSCLPRQRMLQLFVPMGSTEVLSSSTEPLPTQTSMAFRENSHQNLHFLPGSACDTSKAPHSGFLGRSPHSSCVTSDTELLPTHPLRVPLILLIPAQHSALATFSQSGVSTADIGSLRPCQSMPRHCHVSGLSLHLFSLSPSELLLLGKASIEQVLEASGHSLTLWGRG